MSIPFDRVADRFDETRGYPDHVMSEILSALSEVLDRRKAVLDAGVGTGRFAAPLQAMSYTVIGVDISPRMMEKARGKGVEGLVRADVRALPFTDLAFGSAMSIHLLHLISDWRRALAEIGRVTQEVYVSVAFEKRDSPAQRMRDYYDEVCVQLGYDTTHPGMRERELPDILPPDTRRLIVQHEHEINVANLISEYESRTYSSQWAVPEDIHAQAIDAMKKRYSGVEKVTGVEWISLLVWRAERLRALADTQSRRVP